MTRGTPYVCPTLLETPFHGMTATASPTPQPASGAASDARGLHRPQLFDLFGERPELLTIGETAVLFGEELGIHETTFYRSYREFLPFVYTRMVRVRGDKTRFKPGNPRIERSVALAIARLAARGYFPLYASGGLKERMPHLYHAPGVSKA